jgi:hypothetical protein
MADDPDKPVFKTTGFTTGIVAGALGSGATFPAPPKSVVAVKGFLEGPQVVYQKNAPGQLPEYTPADPVFRLYVDDTFTQWLEFGPTAIEAQITIPPNLVDPRSIVWLQRDADVTKCSSGLASDKADEVWGADPGGGPNVPRHPPY